MKDEHDATPRAEHDEAALPEDATEAQLAGAAAGDDAERLKVLEELYGDLEGELEGDLDQEGSPRR